MSIRYHIASKYQIEFAGGEFLYDDFEELMRLLLDAAEENGFDPPMTADADDTWVEFDRGILEEMLECSTLGEASDRIKQFIQELLAGGDPNNDFIRAEVW